MTARDQEPIPIRLGQPRPAWVTLLREDGSIERFPTQGDYLVLPPQPIGRHRLLNEDRPERCCHLTVAPGRLLSAAAAAGRRTALRHRGAPLFPAIAGRPGYRRLHHTRPLRHRSRPRRRLHRRSEPAARAVPARPKPSEPVSTIGPALPGPDLHRCRPAFPAALTSLRHPVRSTTRRSGQRKRVVLRCRLHPVGSDYRSPIRCCASRRSKQSLKFWAHPTGWLGPPNCATRRAPPSRHLPASTGDTVQFHAFLQNLADRQLAAAAESAAQHGLSLGFYRDLAVGAAPDGAEAWSAQDTLMHGVSVGAPPDPFSSSGPDLVHCRRRTPSPCAATASPRSTTCWSPICATPRRCGSTMSWVCAGYS